MPGGESRPPFFHNVTGDREKTPNVCAQHRSRLRDALRLEGHFEW
jgi:hypothetical protein